MSSPIVPADPRPRIDRAIDTLLRATVVHMPPPWPAYDAGRVLIVAGAALGQVVASIAALPQPVAFEGRTAHAVLTLRPRFFQTGDPGRRFATLIHELLHLDPATPGTLAPERRHAVLPHADHDAEAVALATRLLDALPKTALACLGHHGEVRCAQWLTAPAPDGPAPALFVGPVVMRTTREARTVWW